MPPQRRAFKRKELQKLFDYMDDLVDREYAAGSKRWLPALRDSIDAVNLLIDDLEGVRMEGERFGFRVLRLAPDDENWVEKVLREIGARGLR